MALLMFDEPNRENHCQHCLRRFFGGVPIFLSRWSSQEKFARLSHVGSLEGVFSVVPILRSTSKKKRVWIIFLGA